MNSQPWDKFLLIAIGVIVAGLSGLLLTKALGFGERFVLQEVAPDNEIPESTKQQAVIAERFVNKESVWKNMMMGPKPVPLFVSVPIVESKGQLIQMTDPDSIQLRPPVSNAWLIANNLDYLNSSVLQQDPDGDGFTNEKEWNAKTDPIDPASHPPYAEKLVMHSRQQEEYKLKFSATPEPKFQIQRIPTAKWPQRKTFIMAMGETSEDGQFRIDNFEKKEAKRNGITVDASVLTITFLPKQSQHELVKNVEELMPTYFAELEFLLEPGKKFYVKEGEAFNLLKDPETKYRVKEVKENSVIVLYQTGEGPEVSLEIEKK